MRELERRVVLSVLDRKWREHLYEMDYLREGIGLRAMAQRDPLVEYQREGYDLFNSMMEGIKEESVGNLFNLQVEVQENPIVEDADGQGGPAPFGLRQAPAAGRLGQPAVAGAGGLGAGAAGPAAAGAGANGPGAGNAPASGRHARGGSGGGRAAQSGGRGTQPGGRAAQTDAQDDAQAAAGTPSVAAPGLSRPQRPSRLSYSAPSADGGGQVERRTESAGDGKFAKVGRNAPCPCGSGRKYKLCHGDPRNRAEA